MNVSRSLALQLQPEEVLLAQIQGKSTSATQAATARARQKGGRWTYTIGLALAIGGQVIT